MIPKPHFHGHFNPFSDKPFLAYGTSLPLSQQTDSLSGMEFGKLSSVDHVNWTLPAQDSLSQEFLLSLKPATTQAKFYIGTPAWNHKEWIGKIYPKATKPADFLTYYAQNFNTIELNTTHYRIPDSETVLKWRSQVSSDFVFCPKVFQGISHSEPGMLDKKILHEWFAFLDRLKDHRGPCFMQLPPHFDYSRRVILHRFLQEWPSEFELTLEFRHPSWFEEGKILSKLTQFLQTKKIGLVITDVAGRRDVLHSSISADFTMLRFIGNDLHPSDQTRVHDWASRLSEWQNCGLKRVFFFAHEPDDINSPELADIVVRELNTICNAALKPMNWMDLTPAQGSLL
ncbi:MAG TPA: DUF72 domain-containing protein [Bdellovibrio sp.]|uniref:DUF72 domain-containing protein n=1 Tax=Bdellovibrio sp. TaxID=28201 RepID=UPI002EE8DA51